MGMKLSHPMGLLLYTYGGGAGVKEEGRRRVRQWRILLLSRPRGYGPLVQVYLSLAVNFGSCAIFIGIVVGPAAF
jgi:hypothetical protein